MTATAANGQTLSFTVDGGAWSTTRARKCLADVATSNGVIHVIDKVLTPSDAPNDIPQRHNAPVCMIPWLQPWFRLTPETLQGSGPFTLFAPTDQAFIDDAGIDLASLDTPEGKAALRHLVVPRCGRRGSPSAVSE